MQTNNRKDGLMVKVENKNDTFTLLKKFLDENISKDTDMSKITVFPIPCGIGKSEYIKYAIADALQNNKGIIIVTDTIDGLNRYMDAQEEELTKYIHNNLNRISILTSDNIADESRKVYYKPVILMSTQRYFRLTRTEIQKFIIGQKYKRNKIIFDEKIYLLESKRITTQTLNEIDTALDEGLDNTVDSEEKQWILSQFRMFSSKLKFLLEQNERLNEDKKTYKKEGYFDSKGLVMSENDEKFIELIEKYRLYLKGYPDVIDNIRALKKLLIEGAITSQKIRNKKDREKYGNYFTVILNNSDKLINLGAKVFVLDGTADISPEYDLKCVSKVDCSQFHRDLSNLTINIVNVNTSKDKLTKGGDKTNRLLQAIVDYIKSLPITTNTIFTYKAIEDVFRERFKNVNHFGNIKGTNLYRDENHICQVGLHRYSELIYMLYANEIEQCNDTGNDAIVTRIYDKETIDRIRCRFILADIEQNLYRCKIRNSNNTEKCTYTLICNVDESNFTLENYHPLIDLIKSRYEKYGATINLMETPLEFKLLKTKERHQDTHAKKILNWLSEKEKGYVFNITDMLFQLNILADNFKDIKKQNVGIKDLFSKMRIKRGIYKII